VDLGIRGKVALVAASSKGLGRAVAEELATRLNGKDVGTILVHRDLGRE